MPNKLICTLFQIRPFPFWRFANSSQFHIFANWLRPNPKLLHLLDIFVVFIDCGSSFRAVREKCQFLPYRYFRYRTYFDISVIQSVRCRCYCSYLNGNHYYTAACLMTDFSLCYTIRHRYHTSSHTQLVCSAASAASTLFSPQSSVCTTLL